MTQFVLAIAIVALPSTERGGPVHLASCSVDVRADKFEMGLAKFGPAVPEVIEVSADLFDRDDNYLGNYGHRFVGPAAALGRYRYASRAPAAQRDGYANLASRARCVIMNVRMSDGRVWHRRLRAVGARFEDD